jgi:hypothetical protein
MNPFDVFLYSWMGDLPIAQDNINQGDTHLRLGSEQYSKSRFQCSRFQCILDLRYNKSHDMDLFLQLLEEDLNWRLDCLPLRER